jgi:hypothetical protein
MIPLEEFPLNQPPIDGSSDEEAGDGEMMVERGPRYRRRAIKPLVLMYSQYIVGLSLIVSHCAIYITRNDTKVGQDGGEQESLIRYVRSQVVE